MVVLAAVLVAWPAHAGLNLWVSYHYQGTANTADGSFRDAAALLESARQEYCCEPDQAHRLASTLDGLGAARMALSEYEAAEEALRCALDLKRDRLGRRSMHLPATLNHLGDLYFITGDHARARDHYREALALLEDDAGNVETGRALNGMALLHHAAGEPVQTEDLLLRAKGLHERNLRRWHPYRATVCINLAVLYTSQEQYGEAAAMLEQARRVQDRALGASHPDVALRLEAESALAAATGRTGRARTLQDRADTIRAAFAVENQPATASAG
jgi:tetratricopeptide (TPR) repeat protein